MDSTSGGKITIDGKEAANTEPAPPVSEAMRGWVCPVCNGGVSALQLRCPCVPIPATPIPWQIPQTPYRWQAQETHRVPDQPFIVYTGSLGVDYDSIGRGVDFDSTGRPFYCNTAETDMRDKAIGSARSSLGDWLDITGPGLLCGCGALAWKDGNCDDCRAQA